MSLKERLEALSNITPLPSGGKRVAEPTAPKTAPGKMLGLVDKNEQLTEQLRALERTAGERQVALDPHRVRFSRFANRNPAAFASPEFVQLRDSVRQMGGNQVPVIVRPLQGDASADYEIVYGHRRHQACLQVGCQLQAIIQPLTDRDLFLLMSMENLFREDLSPFEAGTSYRLALAEGVCASQAQLALEIGKSAAHVTQSIRVAELPPEVIAAFPSPLEIQVRWAVALHAALERSRDEILQRARELAAERPRKSAAETYRTLLPSKPSRSKALPVLVKGKSVGTIEVARNGAIGIRLTRGAVTATRLPDLQRALVQFLTTD